MKNDSIATKQANTYPGPRQDSLGNLRGVRPLFLTFLIFISFFLLLVPGLFLFSVSVEKASVFLTLFFLVVFLFFILIFAFYFLRSYLLKFEFRGGK